VCDGAHTHTRASARRRFIFYARRSYLLTTERGGVAIYNGERSRARTKYISRVRRARILCTDRAAGSTVSDDLSLARKIFPKWNTTKTGTHLPEPFTGVVRRVVAYGRLVFAYRVKRDLHARRTAERSAAGRRIG